MKREAGRSSLTNVCSDIGGDGYEFQPLSCAVEQLKRINVEHLPLSFIAGNKGLSCCLCSDGWWRDEVD